MQQKVSHSPASSTQPKPRRDRLNDLTNALKQLPISERLIGGGALAFFIVTFLPWYSVSVSVLRLSTTTSLNAWSYWAGALAGVAAILIVIAQILRMANVKFPFQGKIFFIIAGAFVVLCSLLFLVLATRDHDFASHYLAIGPSVGFFLGILAGLAIIAGGVLQPPAAR